MKEIKLTFKRSLLKDFEFIYESIKMFSKSEEEARYVLKAIKDAILQLENPYLAGSLPYSKKISSLGFFQYVILNGAYIVFYKKNRNQQRVVYYVKNTRMDYQYLIN